MVSALCLRHPKIVVIGIFSNRSNVLHFLEIRTWLEEWFSTAFDMTVPLLSMLSMQRPKQRTCMQHTSQCAFH